MKKVSKSIGMIALVLSLAVSCEKYAEGGSLRKAEKNLTNTWKIESYYLDGIDNTTNLLISNFTETFTDEGTYSRNYIDESGDPKNETGSWELVEEKNKINISGAGSYELTEETSTVSASDYTILKLDKTELWYQFTNGGSSHEFHLIKN